MRPLFDKIVIARILVAILIVVPPVIGYQKITANAERSHRNEQATKLLLHNDGELAQERIDRTVASCQAYNEQRIAIIATSEALIRISASAAPQPLTERDRWLLADFVYRANLQIESVTKPKTCTIGALKLQPLLGIVREAQAIAHDGDLPIPTSSTLLPPTTPTSFAQGPRPTRPPTVSPPTTRPPGPPQTVPPRPACAKQHGRCPPKVTTGGIAGSM